MKHCKKNFPVVTSIEPMYTDTYEYNDKFINNLSLDEFINWNTNNAIDILIANDYPIFHTLNGKVTRCNAYSEYTCKVYSDGRVTLCDAMPIQDSKCTIRDISENPTELKHIYKVYKMYNPLLDEDCKSCKSLLICSGKQFCKKENCKFARRYEINSFIKQLVKY